MSRPIATERELREWARRDESGFSALGPAHVLLWQAEAPDRADHPQDPLVAAWLGALPCPSIVISADAPSRTATRAADVVAPDRASAERLAARIEGSPLAATVLVQVLRCTEALPIAQALVVESLAYASLQSGPEFQRWRRSRDARARGVVPTVEPLILTRDDSRLQIRLNHPQRCNAISVPMRDALVEALRLVLLDPQIRDVEISGAGPCFSSGGDLDEFGTTPDPVTGHLVRSLSLPGALLARCAERTTVRVHGRCIGAGIEFPAFAQHVIAAPDSRFELPELEFGLIPGAGGCVSLPRRIGRQRSAWMALSGEPVDARTALDWGLVDAIEP